MGPKTLPLRTTKEYIMSLKTNAKDCVTPSKSSPKTTIKTTIKTIKIVTKTTTKKK